jgi:hypothetical protein
LRKKPIIVLSSPVAILFIIPISLNEPSFVRFLYRFRILMISKKCILCIRHTAKRLGVALGIWAFCQVIKCGECHARHAFSKKEALDPMACQQFHMGFDHPSGRHGVAPGLTLDGLQKFREASGAHCCP